MEKVKFYLCKECGNLVVLLHEGGGQLVCCGQNMTELKAGTTDAAKEKHVPAIKREGNHIEVQVGSVLHPMEEDHFITNIIAVQGEKFQNKSLKPGDEPKACFDIADGPVTVYEYCNKHGLWKAEA